MCCSFLIQTHIYLLSHPPVLRFSYNLLNWLIRCLVTNRLKQLLVYLFLDSVCSLYRLLVTSGSMWWTKHKFPSAPLQFRKAYRASVITQRVRQLTTSTGAELQNRKWTKKGIEELWAQLLTAYFHFALGTYPSSHRNGSGVAQCWCEGETENTVGPTGLMVIAHNWESNFSWYNPRWIHQRHDTVG